MLQIIYMCKPLQEKPLGAGTWNQNQVVRKTTPTPSFWQRLLIVQHFDPFQKRYKYLLLLLLFTQEFSFCIRFKTRIQNNFQQYATVSVSFTILTDYTNLRLWQKISFQKLRLLHWLQITDKTCKDSISKKSPQSHVNILITNALFSIQNFLSVSTFHLFVFWQL